MTMSLAWSGTKDGHTLVLRRNGVPAALVWREGADVWRAAAADDASPGDRHPTRAQAEDAAVAIARRHVAVAPCDCRGGPGRPDTDGRCFTCSGSLVAQRCAA